MKVFDNSYDKIIVENVGGEENEKLSYHVTYNIFSFLTCKHVNKIMSKICRYYVESTIRDVFMN